LSINSISDIAVPRILVVEDDVEVQTVVLEFLRTAGHDVFCAASAEQARRLLADKVIDLALVDCLMSGERGISLPEHAVRLGVPTILTSGDPHYLEARPEGRFPFLPKPFRLSALDELISRTLQAWSR
jgi:two-component system OmpR family response regulator